MAVREWFAGQEILLTGVTSDIGNVVLEKLLRSCPGVKAIHLIVRSRNNQTNEDRIKNIFASPGFERLRQQCPDAISRVKTIEGNLVYDDLGVIEDQLNILKNVSVVIHAGGPHDALFEFCSELPSLKAASAVMNLFKQRRKTSNDESFPNIPLSILRVPAVGPALKEPMPGFLNVFKGATALMVGAGYALGDDNLPASILPVDIAANTLIASAWGKATSTEKENVTIYNSPALNCTWRRLIESGRKASKKFPYPSFGMRGMTANPWLHWFVVLFFEWLPSVLCDTILQVLGTKPRIVDDHLRIRTALQALDPVLSRSWPTDQKSLTELNNRMSPEDQEEFFVTPEIDLETYVLCAAAGVKKLCPNNNAKIVNMFKFVLCAALAVALFFMVFI
ncbi:putative fatty acyl-CoA reductase CG5065 [Athalia rosae]|uniref:putative fatty acyl-CoA reductase CG5065 n=1 Tax=Athalia rosae TaxID=37344 RepID=UPI0020343AEE|nr:putative fatty acyl-CoA reductase CG5065 [Athalia rosae]